MRVPSATGLVFGALALSGSTLAAPTPASPNPSSPNPNAMDSPRMADSPTMGGSPLLGSRWLSASPAVRDGSGRRRSIPRSATRDNKKKPNAGQVHAQGLGLLPQPIKDTVGGLLNTVDGVVAGLPVVGPLLGHTIGDTGKSVLDALDVKDKHKDKHAKAAKAKGKPAAPPMARSIAHIDAQDDEGDNSEDGPPRTFPRRQLTPPAIQLPPSANAATGVAGGITNSLASTLRNLAATLDDTLPIIGTTVGGVVQTVANGVVPRALPVSPPDFLEQALPVPVAPPSTPDPDSILDVISQLTGTLPADVLPAPVKGASETVAGTPGSVLNPRAPLANEPSQLPVQTVGQAVNELPEPVGGVVEGVTGTAPSLVPVSGDESPAKLAGGAITSVPVFLPIPGSALRGAGRLAGVADVQAQNALSTASGVAPAPASAPALPVTPAPPSVPKGRRGVADMLNDTPLGGFANTLTDTIATTPFGGASNTAPRAAAGSPAGGVINTVSGTASNLPIANIPDAAMGTAAGTPAGGVVNIVTGAASSLPIAGIAGGVPVAGAISRGVLGGPGESGSDLGAKDVDDGQAHHHSSSSATAPSATMSV
ncbi:hypothetical protein FRB95_013688 [Tulasnella sp. JGI-2019a]|nr:hypothetical protein FRB95_013688 [Tulasnella sp. JGI-2019a]